MISISGSGLACEHLTGCTITCTTLIVTQPPPLIALGSHPTDWMGFCYY